MSRNVAGVLVVGSFLHGDGCYSTVPGISQVFIF